MSSLRSLWEVVETFQVDNITWFRAGQVFSVEQRGEYILLVFTDGRRYEVPKEAFDTWMDDGKIRPLF